MSRRPLREIQCAAVKFTFSRLFMRLTWLLSVLIARPYITEERAKLAAGKESAAVPMRRHARQGPLRPAARLSTNLGNFFLIFFFLLFSFIALVLHILHYARHLEQRAHTYVYTQSLGALVFCAFYSLACVMRHRAAIAIV